MTQLLTTISKIYADALIELGDFDETLKELDIITEIYSNSKDLVQILESPTVSVEKKFLIIDEVFSKDINEKMRNFLKVLAEKKRFNEFSNIKEAFSNEVDKIKNIKRIEVISAIELNEDKKQAVIRKLKEKLQKEIIANWNTDKSIIGGLIIKIDDNVIDTSLKNKLKNLSKNIEV